MTLRNMSKVSVIIPARFENSPAVGGKTVLQKTTEDVLAKAKGEIEILVGFDGPSEGVIGDPRVKSIYHETPIGIKANINDLAARAEGEYLFKLDAHCSVAEGFDEVLKADTEDNWLVTPRFYVLNEQTWQWQDERFYDYFYLSCPFTDSRGFRFKAGGHWPEKTKEKLDILIDETPQFHGSGWFVNRKFFLEEIKGFPTEDPLGHAQEPPNLGLKYWLGPWGGKVVVNKKTWYAHMHKGSQHDRGYHYTNIENEHSYKLWAEFWMQNKWQERAYDIEWFIEKFYPLPTWPDNWPELFEKYHGQHA